MSRAEPEIEGNVATLATTGRPDLATATDPAVSDGRRRRLGPVFWISLGWLVVVILAAILANVLPIASPTQVGLTLPGAGPSLHHLLGGDDIGRDELSRLIFGARISLVVGFSATIVGLSVSLILGMVAGYFGGLTDRIITFVADTLLAFPSLVVAVVVIAFIGPNILVIIGSLALGAIAPGTRVFRGVTIRWAGQDFVLASRLLGARSRRLISREILPNMLPTVVSYGLISVSVVISIEAVLSYFGISERPPNPSWGNMINEGTGYLQNYPYLVVWPSLVLLLTVLALNLLADQLQGFFDVREGGL